MYEGMCVMAEFGRSSVVLCVVCLMCVVYEGVCCVQQPNLRDPLGA